LLEDMAHAQEEHASRIARIQGLYAIVGEEDPVGQARAALEGGAGVVQVRMKRAPAGEVLAASRAIVAMARGRALVLVNDRADLAILAGADGAHVGDDDLPPEEARRILGPALLLGRSTRTLAEARAAIASGADHVGFGPMFGTRSKALAVPARGLPALREVAGALGAPVVAIGGITLDTVGEISACGAAAAAIIEDLLSRGDVRARAALLAARFEAGRRERGVRP
jgi:thiamine-phosphate pyrophosphorylase